MRDLLIAVRAVHLLSTIVVSGAMVFAWFVAEPALRTPAGSVAAEDFSRQTVRLVAVNLGVSVASGAAWLWLLAARIGDGSITAGLDETVWILLTRTQFGWVWQVRFAAAALLAMLLASRSGLARSSRTFAVTVVGALLTMTLAWSGHGGATPGRAGYLHSTADALHLLAGSAWIGGLVGLVMLLRLQSSGHVCAMIASDAVRRFSTLGVATVLTLLATGIVNTWFLVGGMAALIETGYGRLLLFKLCLFLGMAGFAVFNRLRLVPRLATLGAEANALRDIRNNAFVEIALGIGVLIIVGALGITLPGMPAHPATHAHESTIRSR